MKIRIILEIADVVNDTRLRQLRDKVREITYKWIEPTEIHIEHIVDDRSLKVYIDDV